MLQESDIKAMPDERPAGASARFTNTLRPEAIRKGVPKLRKPLSRKAMKLKLKKQEAMKLRNVLFALAAGLGICSCGGGNADRNTALQDIKLIPVMKDHYYSYVNLKGEPAFEETFKEADWFSDGLALVKKRESGKYAFINERGETVIDASKYDVDGGVTGFWEGIAWAKGRTYKSPYVAINTKGEELFEVPGVPKTLFCNGTAWIKKDRHSEEYMLVDKTGKVVAEFGPKTLPEDVYMQPYPVLCDRVCAYKITGRGSARYGALDVAGNQKVDYLYKEELLFDRGGLAVAENEDGKYGVVDKDGKVVIPFEYDKMEKDGDLYKVVIGKETGWCDRKGKMVVALRDKIRAETYFAWNDQAYNSGWSIDRKGKEKISTMLFAKYPVSPIIGNEVMVVSNQVLIDKNGHTLTKGRIYLRGESMFSDQAYAFHMGLPYVSFFPQQW